MVSYIVSRLYERCRNNSIMPDFRKQFKDYIAKHAVGETIEDSIANEAKRLGLLTTKGCLSMAAAKKFLPPPGHALARDYINDYSVSEAIKSGADDVDCKVSNAFLSGCSAETAAEILFGDGTMLDDVPELLYGACKSQDQTRILTMDREGHQLWLERDNFIAVAYNPRGFEVKVGHYPVKAACDFDNMMEQIECDPYCLDATANGKLIAEIVKRKEARNG
jgi:hypothetical protein